MKSWAAFKVMPTTFMRRDRQVHSTTGTPHPLICVICAICGFKIVDTPATKLYDCMRVAGLLITSTQQ